MTQDTGRPVVSDCLLLLNKSRDVGFVWSFVVAAVSVKVRCGVDVDVPYMWSPIITHHASTSCDVANEFKVASSSSFRKKRKDNECLLNEFNHPSLTLNKFFLSPDV